MVLPEACCSACGRSYPPAGTPYCCPACEGVYDYPDLPAYNPDLVDRSQPGIWRFRHTFGFPAEVEAISLGEGHTPLIRAEAFGREVFFKCEQLNPTGSFKDRGTSTLVSFLHARGVTEAVEDSSGNAGASFAAYAARAGIRARVYIPENASGPKRKQVEAYGASVIPVRGSRSDVSEAVKIEAEGGTAYASHAYLPFNLPGYATTAYEIFEQLGSTPGTVIAPVGQGGMLLGCWRGFSALRQAGLTGEVPRLVGVQARACAPLWAMATTGMQEQNLMIETPTLAEGVRVRQPLRAKTLLEAVAASRGTICAVEEEAILPGQAELGRRGLYVEPTSALAWDGLAQVTASMPDPIVVILTGSGFKSR